MLVQHAPVFPAFGFRFDTPDGSVVFSGDTGPCDNVVRLARGADVLVHEVIDVDRMTDRLSRLPNQRSGSQPPRRVAHVARAGRRRSRRGRVSARSCCPTWCPATSNRRRRSGRRGCAPRSTARCCAASTSTSSRSDEVSGATPRAHPVRAVRKARARSKIASTSAAPSKKWSAPGTTSSSTGTPGGAERLGEVGRSGRTAPRCHARRAAAGTAGRQGGRCVIGLAGPGELEVLTDRTADEVGLEACRREWRSSASRSVTAYQHTTPATGGASVTSAERAARWPPADAPHRYLRSGSTPSSPACACSHRSASTMSSSCAGAIASALKR